MPVIPKLRVPLAVVGGGPPRTNYCSKPTSEDGQMLTHASEFTGSVVDAAVEGIGAVPTRAELLDKSVFVSGTTANVGYFPFTAPFAGVWTVSISCFMPANWDGGEVHFNAEGYTGALNEVDVLKAAPATKGSWRRVAMEVTLDAGDLAGNFVLRQTSAPSVGRALYFTGGLIEAGGGVGAFFPRVDQLSVGTVTFTGEEYESPSVLQLPASLATVEQDSLDEITQCVEAALGTIVGSRIDAPDYGITDETFDTLRPEEDADALVAAVSDVEPRAHLLGEAVLRELATKRVRIEVGA